MADNQTSGANGGFALGAGLAQGRVGGAGVRTALLSVAALACWLAAMPASAQQKPAEPAAGASKGAGDAERAMVPGAAPRTVPKEGVVGAGESAATPTADSTARKELFIVGSTTMEPFTDAVIARLLHDYQMPQPIMKLKGTKKGYKDFCAGVGPEFPDIVAASHGMSKSMYDTCLENNVLDVIEVKIGLSAVVVVAKKGDPVFDLSPRMFYFAVAEDIPVKGEFKSNPNLSWKQVDKEAPDIQINVLIPAKGSGTRDIFNDDFMQGGCRHVKEIDAVFSAEDRVPLCITIRDDGRVIEVTEPYGPKIVDALAKAPAGTLAIVGLPVYIANKDKLDVLPVDGVMPTHENVTNYNYEMSSDLRFYFKRAHMRNNKGEGVVRGIREFMTEIVKDGAFGDGGYFETLGLVAMPESAQNTERKIVRTLKRFVR